MSKTAAGSVTLKFGTRDLTVFYSAVRTGHILDPEGYDLEIISVMYKGIDIYPVLEFLEHKDGFTKIYESIEREALAQLYGEKEVSC